MTHKTDSTLRREHDTYRTPAADGSVAVTGAVVVGLLVAAFAVVNPVLAGSLVFGALVGVLAG